MPKLSKPEQSRINGAKSRGPKTPEGKAISSLNRLKHGRYAKNTAILSTENSAAFQEQLDSCLGLIRPRSLQESRLCRELVALDWQIARFALADTRMINQEIRMLRASHPPLGRPPSPDELTGTAIEGLAERSAALRFVSQRISQLRRDRRHLLETLLQYREKFPNSDESSQIHEPIALDPDAPDGTNPPLEPNRTQKEP